MNVGFCQTYFFCGCSLTNRYSGTAIASAKNSWKSVLSLYPKKIYWKRVLGHWLDLNR